MLGIHILNEVLSGWKLITFHNSGETAGRHPGDVEEGEGSSVPYVRGSKCDVYFCLKQQFRSSLFIAS